MQWIWDQMSDYKNVATVNNPLVYWPSFTGGQLIPDPDGLARCLAKTHDLLAGSGISNNEKNQRSATGLYIAPGFALMHS